MTPTVAFLLDDFAVPSPAQQLLDRFLIGHNKDGRFNSRAPQVRVHFVKSVTNAALEQREKEFGLKLVSSIADLVQNANALIIALNPDSNSTSLYQQAISAPSANKRCFIYGLAGHTVQEVKDLFAFAFDRGVLLQIGTDARHLIPLPEIKLPIMGNPKRSLIVVQGKFPQAEAAALESLFTAVDFSVHQPLASPAAAHFSGDRLWRLAYSAEWLPLFSAAISRSNTIHGDPDKDGRTQDIVGLHLVEKLASEARGWVLNYHGHHTACILVLDGALSDVNIAAQPHRGDIISTQLYRPPLPLQDHFSAMAAKLVDFFERGATNSREEALLIAAALEQIDKNKPAL